MPPPQIAYIYIRCYEKSYTTYNKRVGCVHLGAHCPKNLRPNISSAGWTAHIAQTCDEIFQVLDGQSTQNRIGRAHIHTCYYYMGCKTYTTTQEFNDWGGQGYDDFVPGEYTKTAPSGMRLHDPLHGRQACPEFIAFDQGVGRICSRRGYFRAFSSQNGDKYITSPPPPSIVECIHPAIYLILLTSIRRENNNIPGTAFLKKNLNAPRPFEHPSPSQGGKCQNV